MIANTDTQQRILSAARDLIYARSYGDEGVAQICEIARVKKGSFYHFFPSKIELTLAVTDNLFADLKRDLMDAAFIDDIPPLQRLHRLATFAYHLQKQIAEGAGQVLGCPFGNLAVEMATQDASIRDKIASIFMRMQESIRQVLHEARTEGEIPPEIDIAATAQAMIAYFEGVLLLAKTRNDVEIIAQLLPAMADIRITQR